MLKRLSGPALKKQLRLFAACVYLLIKEELANLEGITIDIEYPGHHNEIKWILLNLLKRDLGARVQRIKIEFERIGRRSKAHIVAWETLRKKRKPARTLTSREILSTLFK